MNDEVRSDSRGGGVEKGVEEQKEQKSRRDVNSSPNRESDERFKRENRIPPLPHLG